MSVDLISRDERTFDKAVSWDSDKRLDFALPFQDMKPSIYLGMCVCVLLATVFSFPFLFPFSFPI